MQENNKGLKIFTIITLIISIALGGFLGYCLYKNLKPVKVENLVGKTANNAYEFCGKLSSKYSCNIIYEQSSDYDEGIVFEQSIKEGETLKDVLTIKISTGKKAKIDDFVISDKTTVNDAQKWAEKNGIEKTYIINEESETVAKGIVIRIEVAQNELEETVLNIIVSSGSKNSKTGDIDVTYGDYIGYSEEEFIKKAKELKLTAHHKEENDDYSETIEKGKIVWHGSGSYEENEEFNYALSKGKNPDAIVVKFGDYIGISEEDFIKKGKELGLSPNHNKERDAFSDEIEKGKIVWHGSGTYEKDETFNYGLSLGSDENAIKVESGKYLGKLEEEFKKITTDLGLKPNHNTDRDNYSDTIAKGSIVWHGSGTYTKDETINYGISKGAAPKVTVISKAGSSLNEFKTYITGLGLKLGTKTSQYSDTVAVDLIISNVTGEYKAGSTIDYTVSLGKDTRVSVPSFANKNETELTNFLSTNKLVGSRSEEYSSTVAQGNIISNNSGSYNEGDTISYIVSKGVKKIALNNMADIVSKTTVAGDYSACCEKVRTYLSEQGFTSISFDNGKTDKNYGAGVLLKITVNGSPHVSYSEYDANATIVCTVCTGHEDD